ncbi:MAG: acyltransferase [Alphaproteobacteria bacterium]|nr:acyltransferase [Alphaproteobacteria bacterium]
MPDNTHPKLVVGNRYREIDGLRAIAAFLVIWAHAADMAGAISSDNILTNFYMNIARLGSSGVTLFFIISGFLITGILIDTKDHPDKFKNFYIRRTLRIVPLYYAALLLIYILINCFSLSGGNYQLSQVFLYHILFISNWVPYFDPNNLATSYADLAWFMHLWSMAVEQQFYIFWPALFFVLYQDRSERFVLTVMVSLIVFATVLRIIQTYTWYWWPPYTGTLTRMDALFLGAVLAVLLSKNPDALQKIQAVSAAFVPVLLIVLALVSIAISLGNKGLTLNAVIIVPLTALLYFFLINAMILPAKENALRKFLNTRYIQYSGKISYGLYIFSVPVQITLGNMLIDMGSKNYWVNHIVMLVAGLAITHAMASLSYTFMERPIMRLKKTWAPYDNRKRA